MKQAQMAVGWTLNIGALEEKNLRYLLQSAVWLFMQLQERVLCAHTCWVPL